MEELKENKKRERDDSESADLYQSDSPEVKRLRENLLDGLDDEAEFCTEIQDLDSFMRSFEEEITASPSGAVGEEAEVVDLTSDSGESRPDLGYLFDASDDELGLPPPTSSPVVSVSESVLVNSDSSEIGDVVLEAPGYDSFGFGFGDRLSELNGGDVEYALLDGLFDYSDMGFGSGDFAYRPETLPAQ